MNPAVEALLRQPCRHCGGLERSHFPEIALSPSVPIFEHSGPSSTATEARPGAVPYVFEIVVCRSCQCVDWFVPMNTNGFDLSMLEANHAHAVHRVASPYR